MTIPWDQGLYDKYAAMLEEVFALWRSGNRQAASELGEQWFLEVPDFEGMAEKQSSRMLARVAAEAGDVVAARVWLTRAREAYGGSLASDGARSMLGFVEGIISFHEGDLDRAFGYFKASHDFLGKRAFDLPDDQEYWDFFSGRAGLKKRRKASTKDLEKLAEQGDKLQAAGDLAGAAEV